jgi:hypothetical protein
MIEGSGFGSIWDPYLWLMDPDPEAQKHSAFFASSNQAKTKSPWSGKKAVGKGRLILLAKTKTILILHLLLLHCTMYCSPHVPLRHSIYFFARKEGPVRIQYKCFFGIPILLVQPLESREGLGTAAKQWLAAVPFPPLRSCGWAVSLHKWPTYKFPIWKITDHKCKQLILVVNSFLALRVNEITNKIDHGDYINRSQIHECGNWERGRAVSFLGIIVSS